MRVVPKESQLTGPFKVDTLIDFDLLVPGNGAANVAFPVREARQTRVDPARLPVTKARRDIVLETGDSGTTESEIIG
jgi:hypothetical protein